MKNYQEWYRNISSRLTSYPTLLFLLRSFNRLMTVAMPMVYLTLLVTTEGLTAFFFYTILEDKRLICRQKSNE